MRKKASSKATGKMGSKAHERAEMKHIEALEHMHAKMKPKKAKKGKY